MEELDDPVLRGPIPTPFYRKAIADYHRFVSRRQTSTE
jgi:hypothetical protein